MEPVELLRCSIIDWYPLFKNVTIKSTIFPLPSEALDYLKSDGVILPSQLTTTGTLSNELKAWFEKITEEIEKLGGVVFPKLNWSSPKDASWIALGRTLRCDSVDDVCLLLKSSDFISHDLHLPFEGCGEVRPDVLQSLQYSLTLREWTEIPESLEFRVFVKNQKIIGISQRNCSQSFPELESMKERISHSICTFFSKEIREKFTSSNYVMDVFARLRSSGGREWTSIKLIDFGPWTSLTDSLLFSWTELLELNEASVEELPELRLGKSEEVKANEFLSYGFPSDLRLLQKNDLASLIASAEQADERNSGSSSIE